LKNIINRKGRAIACQQTPSRLLSPLQISSTLWLGFGRLMKNQRGVRIRLL